MTSKYSIVYLIVIVIYSLFSFKVHSQSQDNYLGKPAFHYIKSNKLIGKWISVDSTKNTIEFMDSSFQVVLFVSGSHPYYFSVDSLGNVFSSGYFPNWPPYDCDLNFISRDTLQVTYSIMGDHGASYFYVRRKK